ncbi:MAG: hypothetical protein KDB53_03090, partial [Planctomycetes bacterium]|nr:hypothetical protein [Planctomycetota bacterium]
LDRSTNNVSVDDVIARTSNLDSDDGADWTNGPDGTETPGAVNPGQSLGPPVAKALILDTGPSAVWVQNATTGALSVSGIVAAVEVDGGILLTDPTVDPLIGAAVTINASAFGGNPQTLLNTLLAGTVLQIALADGSGAVQLTASFQSQGSADWHLGGSLGATPIPTRPVTSMSSISTLVTGNASPLLSSLVAPLGNETLSLLVALEPGGKRLAAIERSFALEANPAFLSRLANDGQGGLEVGVIGAQGSELWNVFAVNSSFAPAAGPFFGIDFGPIQYALAVLPIGTVPFHVVPDPGGVHHFRTPINFVPIGWVVDHIAVEQRQGLTVASPFTRVYF